MKAIGSVVGLVAGSLGLIAGAVFGLDDEGTLVSPPQIVAQGFIEAIAHGRTGPAHRMLAREAHPIGSNGFFGRGPTGGSPIKTSPTRFM